MGRFGGQNVKTAGDQCTGKGLVAATRGPPLDCPSQIKPLALLALASAWMILDGPRQALTILELALTILELALTILE